MRLCLKKERKKEKMEEEGSFLACTSEDQGS
jgi:hypothetical protein